MTAPDRCAAFQAPAFSFLRVFALSANTLTELTRMKIFYFLLVFGMVVVGTSPFSAELQPEAQIQLLKDVALGGMSIFTSLLAILATAMLIPKDIEDRTIYTILSKPVPRLEYLLGKLLGVLAMLLIATLIMAALFLAALWFRESSEIAAGRAQYTGDDLAIYVSKVKASAFNANLAPGIAIVFLKAAILAVFTILVSTFATSSVFTMMISIAVYFIGHLQAPAREYWLEKVEPHWWTKPLLGCIALLFPDLQAFSLLDDIVVGTPIPAAIFFKTAALGAVYVLVYFLLATFSFSNREL